MMDYFLQLNDVDLEPHFYEEIDLRLCLKNFLLFARYDDEIIAVIGQDNAAYAINHLTKLDLHLPIYQLDQESYERLKDKYLEIQTGSDFDDMETNSDDLIEGETDLLDFIRSSQNLLSNESSAPVVRLVNSLFFQAIKKGASDIHIQSEENRGRVRFRIDGALKKHLDVDYKIIGLIINRIKVISGLDISEKRLPQDGRTQIVIAKKKLDVRVSILPTYYGERVVMRLLMQGDQIPTMDELGFEKSLVEKFYRLLQHSHGMILATGPTGSGKTTTLHSFLQYIATPDKNIITIEDPVEYNANNVSQIQVNEKVGLSFASGLRSILRQDPDVIMVGEIRDKQTAQIAIQSALTGHLMFSTLHTNNSTASITRLIDMGVENFLISSTLLGVLAQRLVRKLCDECKQSVLLTKDQKDLLGNIPKNAHFYEAKGCKKCDFTGYHGRKAIGELFVISDTTKEIIEKKGSSDYELRSLAKKEGMKTIADSLKDMLYSGETSYEEAVRLGALDE